MEEHGGRGLAGVAWPTGWVGVGRWGAQGSPRGACAPTKSLASQLLGAGGSMGKEGVWGQAF